MNLLFKLMEFLKNLIDGKDRKKLVEYALMVVIAGIIIIIAGSTLFEGSGGKNENNQSPDMIDVEAASRSASQDDAEDIAREIGKVLSEIEGAGKVTVMITYSSGEEIVPAQDTKRLQNRTQERDNGGGTRNISQDEYESRIVFEDGEGGTKTPIVLKRKMPEVKGVVVVAEGAGDAVVKENLVRAVQVLADVPVHRIQVFKKGK